MLAVRLHAFLALLVTSLAVALLGGIPLAEVAAEVQRAMGASLGYIAVVIDVGAIFGELLRRSGGAAAIADALLGSLGDRRAPLALGATGLVVALPGMGGRVRRNTQRRTAGSSCSGRFALPPRRAASPELVVREADDIAMKAHLP